MKRFITAVAALLAVLAAGAVVTDIIRLKNGDTYCGFIWMQLSNGEIGVAADTSTVYLPQTDIAKIEYLPQKTNGGNKHRLMADIHLAVRDSVVVVEEPTAVIADTVAVAYPVGTDDGIVEEKSVGEDIVEEVSIAFPEGEIIRGVEILEEGSVVKYRDTNPQEIRTRMSEVLEISRPARNPQQINGLYDEIVTRSGKIFRGQVVSIEPGKTIRINDNGRIYRIPVRQIDIQRRKAIDPEESVFIQSPLFDNIYLEDGNILTEVLLMEQNFGNGTFDVIDPNNVVKQYPLSQLKKIRRNQNERYRPRMEFRYEEGAYYINRVSASPVEGQSRRGRIKVKVSLAEVQDFRSDNGKITLECADDMTNRRIILVPLPPVEYGEASFNPKYLVEKAIPTDSQSVDRAKRILSREYSVLPGYYAFVDSENSTVILLHVI